MRGGSPRPSKHCRVDNCERNLVSLNAMQAKEERRHTVAMAKIKCLRFEALFKQRECCGLNACSESDLIAVPDGIELA